MPAGSLTTTTAGFSVMTVSFETVTGYLIGTISFKVFIASLIVFCYLTLDYGTTVVLTGSLTITTGYFTTVGYFNITG